MSKLRGYVALGAVVLVAAVLVQTAAGQALMRGLGLSKTPTGYAQLSFAHPQALPGTLPSPRATVAVPFEIRNSASAPRTYQWSIVLAHGAGTQRLASGNVQVPAGKAVTVARTLRFSCPAGPVRLTVGLANPRESIDFLATCSAAGAGTQ
jgi:hypothetical protein